MSAFQQERNVGDTPISSCWRYGRNCRCLTVCRCMSNCYCTWHCNSHKWKCCHVRKWYWRKMTTCLCNWSTILKRLNGGHRNIRQRTKILNRQRIKRIVVHVIQVICRWSEHLRDTLHVTWRQFNISYVVWEVLQSRWTKRIAAEQHTGYMFHQLVVWQRTTTTYVGTARRRMITGVG